MANVHVVSCGTSILGAMLKNRASVDSLGGLKGDSVAELARYLQDHGEALASARELALNNPGWSAELTAMRAYLEKKEVDVAYLVQTNTPASRLCTDWLQAYLQTKGVKVKRAKFEGYADPGTELGAARRAAAFAADLQVLRAQALRLVVKHRAQGDNVFIGAQGGYKPEAGVMMLVGAETHTTVYYAHEDMRECVEIPVLIYRGKTDGLLALNGVGGSVTSTRAGDLLAHHPELEDAAAAYAVVIRRDGEGTLLEIDLTAYGKFLLEDAGEDA